MGNFFADVYDNIGTTFNLPELGVSELLGGGKSVNTGRVKYNTALGFDSNTGNLIDAVYKAKRTNMSYEKEKPTAHESDPIGDDIYSGAYNGGAGGGSGGGSGGGAAGPAYNPADIAYLDDQRTRLERQHGSASTALKNGITQLGDDYNKQVSSTNGKRSQALQDFAVKREDTARDKDSALVRVGDNARTLAESLRRRLGLASGSGSSAYQIAAPGAVSRQASGNRTGVLESYGKNDRDITTSENRAKSAFEQLLEELTAQRKTKESDFRSAILDRQNQIDQNLSEVARQKALAMGGGYDQVKTAIAPLASRIDSRQSEIDGLFSKYRTPYAVKAVDTSTPTLRNYIVDRANIQANQPGVQDPELPYKNPFAQDDEELVAAY